MFRKEYEKRMKESYNKRFNKYKRFDREKFNKFKDLFGSFKPSTLYDFHTFAIIMSNNNILLEDFIEYVTVVKDIMKEDIINREKSFEKHRQYIMDEIEKKLPKCPECGGILDIYEIKIPKGKRNLKGWKSQLVCRNEKCFYEKFCKEKKENIMKDNNIVINNNLLDISDIVDPDTHKIFGININDKKKGK